MKSVVHLSLFVLVSLFMVTPGGLLFAQSTRLIALKTANATLPAEFSRIVSVRELADGRVLIVDGKDARLVFADFGARTVQVVSRTGSGPGEYRQLFDLFALGGDSTLVPDPSNRRWLLMKDIRMVGSSAPDDPAVAASLANPLGADVSGHVLARVVARGVGGKPSMLDSLRLVLMDRKTGRADTIGKLPSPFASGAGGAPVATSGSGAPKKKSYAMNLSNADRALLFADGWLVIARGKPYHTEWRSPTGVRTVGAQLPFVELKPSDADKRAILAWTAISTGWPPTSEPDEVATWPTTLPPFVDSDRSPLIAVPDGSVAIVRLANASAKDRRYDIVNRRGVLVGTLVMPLNEQLVGFGVRSVYVSTTDGDGIQRLRRHAWQ